MKESNNTANGDLSEAMEEVLLLTKKSPAVVERAFYQIPDPLSRLLNACLLDERGGEEINVQTPDGKEIQCKVKVESQEIGLSNIITNAFQALDSMYFSTPSEVRNKPIFRHRLCIRVSSDSKDGSLTITDLGSGMTRADLINSLGVGRELSPKAQLVSKLLTEFQTFSLNGTKCETADQTSETLNAEEGEEKEDASEEASDSESDDFSSDSDLDGGEFDVGDNVSMVDCSPDIQENVGTIPCQNEDIGGFYAALCSLCTAIKVCTKSKFDEYYEFEIKAGDKNEYKEFTITRPMEEGFVLSTENGFDNFTDIRGESGTKVVLKLNSKAVNAGFLDEQKKLKPLIAKILESSEYSVAFSTDDACVVKDIIQASVIEQEAIHNKKNMNDNDMSLDDNCDVSWRNDVDQSSMNCNNVLERSKFIPLRLSLSERKMLRLVEATMTCTEYTTSIDNHTFKSKTRRTHSQLKAISAVLKGMVLACDYSAGQNLITEGNYVEYKDFFQSMFEIARRHKIMNPEKMRTEYGKLIYMLQDAISEAIQFQLGFSVKGPISTVYRFLEERDGLKMLSDSLIETATREVLAEKKSRAKINSEIKRKEKAVASLKAKYQSSKLSTEDIHLCLYSICDNNSFLNSNRNPIDKVIGLLKKYFRPDKIENGYSLSIISGQDGSRLSHSHERQYYFALQSLTLWREIISDMFKLWHMAEEDLLNDAITYALKDTGQGMQRIQQSPRTYRVMQQILSRVQVQVNVWIGSSVIHLGDHNVPNALSFIDKYTQVPRILGPIVSCLENLERIYDEDDGIKGYIDSNYGGLDCVRKDILYDFIRSAFDGSGADNYYDAGSCIDGRLTSAWNWCSQLHHKKYYPIFKLTGFTGFDGEFK